MSQGLRSRVKIASFIHISFEIPEGYMVAGESVEALKHSVASRDGVFQTSPSVEGNKLTVRVVERHPRTISSPYSWPGVLKVLDAAHDFQSASIVLKPTK